MGKSKNKAFKYLEPLIYYSDIKISEEIKSLYVEGYGTILVNNLGTYFETKTGKFPSIWENEWGYLIFKVGSQNKTYELKIHRLVAQAFIPNPYNLPEVNHKDGNKLNNCYTNLEWCSNLQNMRHAWKNGLIVANKYEKNGRSKLTEEQVKKIKKDLNNGRTAVSLAKEYEVSASTIDCIKQKRTWVGIE